LYRWIRCQAGTRKTAPSKDETFSLLGEVDSGSCAAAAADRRQD
jgi:hypothetical protein